MLYIWSGSIAVITTVSKTDRRGFESLLDHTKTTNMSTIHRTVGPSSSSHKKSSTEKKKKKTDDYPVTKVEEIPLNFYAVRSKDGKWLRAKGFGGSGESWVSGITKAKIYGSTRAPKAQITFWANNYPKFGVPDLVRITTGKCEYLDQTERVSDIKLKNKVKEADREVKRWINLNLAHAKKVMAFRGEGNDAESVRIRQNLAKAEANLRTAKEELEKHKQMK